MKKLILDTDVIIDHVRAGVGPLLEALDWQQKGKAEVYVSAVTVLELWAGESASKLQDELNQLLNQIRVVEISRELGQFAGEMKRKLGGGVALADLIIGATAVWVKGELVTKNKKDFVQVPGVKFWKG